MKRIDELDKNFKLSTKIDREGLAFYDSKEEPFTVHGLIREGDMWVRVPEKIARTVSPGVHVLSKVSSGGRLRFVTDSPYVAIKTVQPEKDQLDLMPMTGMVGFDLYVGEGKGATYVNTFRPPVTPCEGYESVIDISPVRERRLITIHFPLYGGVNELYIGLKEDSIVEKAEPYAYSTSFVYYGSSITMGGCATRPGMTYQSILSRRFDADYISLGFSGNALGEREIAQYAASLDMSLFVLDYDHNAPNAEHLEKTHEPFFLAVREKHPDIPIIILPRPHAKVTEDDLRVKVIRKTYENAIARGDKNVYYIPSKELMSICGADGTVDNCHPTDFGFYSMAERISLEIEKIIADGKLKKN